MIIFDQSDPLKILSWKVQVFIYYSRCIVLFLLSVKYEYVFIYVTRTQTYVGITKVQGLNTFE